jgi:hypothetical protein
MCGPVCRFWNSPRSGVQGSPSKNAIPEDCQILSEGSEKPGETIRLDLYRKQILEEWKRGKKESDQARRPYGEENAVRRFKRTLEK